MERIYIILIIIILKVEIIIIGIYMQEVMIIKEIIIYLQKITRKKMNIY